jgi:hypothetical protein
MAELDDQIRRAVATSSRFCSTGAMPPSAGIA